MRLLNLFDLRKANHMTHFIFVTGGVLSSLGKGIASASIAALLQAHGYKVRIRKLDPYINVDPGTMNPYQHGEVFVTDSGTETDLDLGHYQRFTGVNPEKTDNITAGGIYFDVLTRERRGDYLGKTVQVIPHITDAIKEFILHDTQDLDFLIVEIGGTVGDIESLPFIEAIRQLGNDLGRSKTLYIHLTLVPYVECAGEMKTKPAQHSVKELLGFGIQPDFLLCRCVETLSENARTKLALFCNLPLDHIFNAVDVKTIYEVPLRYHQQEMDSKILKYFKLDSSDSVNLKNWEILVDGIQNPLHHVTVGVIGKYADLLDAYKSLNEALAHGGIDHKTKVQVKWVVAEDLEKENGLDYLKDLDAILIPGGFGNRGVEGKLKAIRYAREHGVPFLGICLGMQLTVVEFARNVLGLQDANSTEIEITNNPVVGLMSVWEKDGKKEQRFQEDNLGGTMRLGAYSCILKENTRAWTIYGVDKISERHRHRYEVNMAYRDRLENRGLIFSGLSPDGSLPEIVEIQGHPWFIGVQFHPEFKSTPFYPHPLFSSFIGAALKYSRGKE